MLIRFGYSIDLELPAVTPLVLMLRLRPELAPRLCFGEEILVAPNVRRDEFHDSFGNRCVRLIAPPGVLEVSCEALIDDSGQPAPVVANAAEHPVAELPAEVLQFLLPSRYCDLELLQPMAWTEFGSTPPGWARVQSVCDWVFNWIHFDYQRARPTRTAHEAYQERVGVCRDFTHLAIAFCRCLNIPARYVTGYLGDIGVPRDPAAMDFSAWMEVYLGHRWHVFDVRHNARRIGHLPIAWGRDAADVAMITSYGPHTLRRFSITTEEVRFQAAERSSRAVAGVASHGGYNP